MMISLLHQAPLCWLKYEDVLPRFRPGRSTRECHVHKCDFEAPASKKSSRKRGHMEPMGSQQSDMTEVERVTLHDPGEFYEKYVAGAAPVVLAGAATAATSGVRWTDDFLYSLCRTDFGEPWQAIIEVNKIIVSNTRWPLLGPEWDFCQFVLNYTKPEHSRGMYVVSPLTDPGVKLGRHVKMPSVLRCSEVHESVHDTRLWMSSGGTSSSLHFDTHENLMLQVVGTKTVYFWPPSVRRTPSSTRTYALHFSHL